MPLWASPETRCHLIHDIVEQNTITIITYGMLLVKVNAFVPIMVEYVTHHQLYKSTTYLSVTWFF